MPGLALLVAGAELLVLGATSVVAALFLGYYAAYVLYLILAASQHAALPAYSGAMLGFVLPLAVATLIVLLLRHRTLAAEVAP